MSRPAQISVVTAAFNAELFLGRMISSLRDQTLQAWELVVIDDGSTDGTAALLAEVAQSDARVKVLSQPNAGAAAARNRGLGEATSDWVLFLDADDNLASDHLKRLYGRTRQEVDGVVCGYVRIDPDGRVTTTHRAPALIDGRFIDVTQGPPVILHSILLRRSLLDRIGGFDPTLKTNEDWDLWGRLARSGARLAREPRALAAYWATSGSLTRGGRRMVEDTATVLRRMAGPDPRVPNPDPRFAAGLPVRSVETRVLIAAVWSAAAAASVGEDGRLADLVGPVDDLSNDWKTLGDAVLDGLTVGSGVRHAGLLLRWPIFGDGLRSQLESLAVASGHSELADRLMQALELDVVRTAVVRKPILVGSSFAVPLQILRGRLPDIPDTATRALVKVAWFRPRSLGIFAIPPKSFHSHAAIVTGIARSIVDRVSHIFKRTLRLTAGSRVGHIG